MIRHPKINHSKTTIRINESIDPDPIDPSVVTLIINSNKTLEIIEKKLELTYLRLNCTLVRHITKCPSLSILIIEKNKILQRLEQLDELSELKTNSCSRLKHIHLNNLCEAVIQNCAQLKTLIIPAAQVLHLIECPRIKFPKISDKLKIVKLHSCRQIRSLDFLRSPNIHLDYLEIQDCSGILEIRGIANCRQFGISDCHALTKICKLSNIEVLSIDDCSHLDHLSEFNNIDNFIISRCDAINILYNLNLHTVVIEYCPKLHSIDNVSTTDLTIRFCNRLFRLYIPNDASNLVLEDCSQLKQIKFKNNHSQPKPDFSIILKGSFAFNSISAWRATSLTIIDNPNIQRIDTVYDLKQLFIQSCDNIYLIQNMLVELSLTISHCVSLSEIENIIGPKIIKLFNLDQLSYLGVDMNSVEALHIENCLDLKTSIDGSNLNELYLINTNAIFIPNLSPNVILKIDNSGYLPDLETGRINILYGAASAAEILIEFNALICLSTTKIIHSIRQQLVKKYIGRHHIIANECYCIICMDSIDSHMRLITKCFHVFHESCIMNWVVRNNSCPVCKEKSLFLNIDADEATDDEQSNTMLLSEYNEW